MPRAALPHLISEFLGVVFFATASVWLIALVTYDPTDAVWFFNAGGELPPMNLAGLAGAFLAEVSYQVFGLASYLVPAVLVVAGWYYFWCLQIDAAYTKLVGSILLFGCSATLLSLGFGTVDVLGRTVRAGGYVGESLTGLLAPYLNRAGSIIVLLALLSLALILVTQFSFGRLFIQAARALGRGLGHARGAVRQWWTKRRRDRQRQGVVRKHLEKAGASTARAEVLAKSQPPVRAARPEKAEPPPAPPEEEETEDLAGMTPMLPLEDLPLKTSTEQRNGSFVHPPLALLDSPKAVQKFDERVLMDNAALLEEKCREFSVAGSVSQCHPGPVVTTFEFKPDAGVKYSKVTRLADDLSLAMQAESVLIERIPGKSTVGIQIPNQVRDEISIRELLESDAYQSSSSKLTLALGKSIHGEPVVTDLTRMPHLLIAGSTGTGKSVALNVILTSVLYRSTPDDVRLILIDPKRLELGMYEEIPHLLTPVVVEPKRAANALRWAVREMESRYKQLATEGVRNIEQYNRNIAARLGESGNDAASDGEEELKPLPFIVVAIDELADLMMVAGNEVEESIARLAQMARAVGIHLILCTQRPSVDVITGLIKANFPSRIAFRVSSKVDSRTILDTNGAEQLLGKGDMLYAPPSTSRTVRLHGPYISEQETARLASFLRKQGKPGYDDTITEEEQPAGTPDFDRDDLYDQAARIVVSSGQASISYLQRRLRIGFSRAARLVDMMEADGLVSAAASGKAREVLVKQDYFEEVDLQPR